MSQEFENAIQDETIEPDAGAANDAIQHDTYTEQIDCKLSDEDAAEKRKRLEDVDREIIRLEEEKKAAAKVSTNKIKPLQAERESILQALDSGTEKKQVEVYELVVEALGKIEVRRVDTDEMVDERAMTASERDDAAAARQGDLFDGGGSQPPPADDDPVTPEDFEPSPEALAQAAEDEGRVVKTNSKAARAKRASKSKPEANQGDAT